MGAVLLRAFYRNDSALSENTSVEVKNNLKKKTKKQAPRRVTDIM